MKINSFLSFSTQDGPGVRSIIFLQGCNLKCIYCHNPETQCYLDKEEGIEIDTSSLLLNILKYKAYYGSMGGVTISGGEPLLQIKEVISLCKKLKNENIHICLETNGYFGDRETTKELLTYCDLIYCDLKFNNDNDYKKYTGIYYLKSVLSFLSLCKELDKDVVVRSVIIPKINDNEEYIMGLKKLLKEKDIQYPIKLLGFNNICIEKYNALNKKFELEDYENMNKDRLNQLQDYLNML